MKRRRWTPKRKLKLVYDARAASPGIIAALNGVTVDEIRDWTERFERDGIKGLYVDPKRAKTRPSQAGRGP